MCCFHLHVSLWQGASPQGRIFFPSFEEVLRLKRLWIAVSLLLFLIPALPAGVAAAQSPSAPSASVSPSKSIPDMMSFIRPHLRREASLPAYPTITETSRALVILIGFQDSPNGALTLAQATDLYFSGSGSVAQYLDAQSQGHFELQGDVIGGAAAGQSTVDLVLPQSTSAYAAMGVDPGQLAIAQDAMSLLDANGFNWTPYENSQGQLGQLVFLMAAPTPSSINSPFYSVETTVGGAQSASGIQISAADFVTQSDGMGTLAHEFGHLLGFDDVYDVSSLSSPTATGCIAGNWDLYDQGNYNSPAGDGSGTTPAPIDPYQLIFAGWVTPTLLSAAGNYTLAPIENSGQVDELTFPDSSEVYLLENVQPTGYDAQLPGSGMLIWKVDTAMVDPQGTYWLSDIINESTGSGAPSHPGISLVSAGNESIPASCGTSADPFPGSDKVTTFSDQTTPSATLDGNIPSNISLSQIAQSGQNISFSLSLLGQVSATLTGPTSPVPGVANTYTVEETQADGTVGGKASFTVSSPWGNPTGTLTNGVGTFTLTPPSAGTATLSVTLSDGTLVQPLTVQAGAFPYTDVASSFWGYPAIQSLFAQGDFQEVPGWTGSTFSPNTPITRAEFVALVLHALGIQATAPANFTDVPSSFWASGEIGEAAALNLVNGTGNGQFSPNGSLTRAQIAALLSRAYGLADNHQRFTFQDAPKGAWYYLSMNLMWQAGYLQGVSPASIDPNGLTTRAQAVTILYRILNSGVKSTVGAGASPHSLSRR